MKTEILLYITAHDLAIFRWRSGQLDHDGTYANDESGHQRFAHYLTSIRKKAVIALVNSAEEHFANEVIPKLRGRDRETIIRRRLEQRFPDAQVTAFLSLGHEHAAENSERLLLAAIARHESLARWLRLIASTGIALTGIYSPSFLAPAVVRLVRRSVSSGLLLTQQDESIRQSYIDDDKLQFSRLTQLSDLSENRIAECFIEAATRLRLYLISQRLLDHDTSIKAYLIAPARIAAILRENIPEDGPLAFDVIAVADIQRHAGVEKAPANIGCEAVLLALAASSPPRTRYADLSMRKALRLSKVRRSLFGAGAIVMAVCLLTSASLCLQTLDTRTATDEERQEAALIRTRLDALQRSLPPVPVSNAQIQSLIVRHHRLHHKNKGPVETFRAISHALSATPAIDIERINWTFDPPPETTGTAMTSATRAARETAVIHGYVVPNQNNSLRAATTQLRHFIALLKETSQFGVKLTRIPSAEAQPTLPSSVAVAPTQQHSFVIELTRNREP